ncbi:hypothetical protein ABH922_003041 [Rhodococcus sp. 27YEA15]
MSVYMLAAILSGIGLMLCAVEVARNFHAEKTGHVIFWLALVFVNIGNIVYIGGVA